MHTVIGQPINSGAFSRGSAWEDLYTKMAQTEACAIKIQIAGGSSTPIAGYLLDPKSLIAPFQCKPELLLMVWEAELLTAILRRE